MTLDRISLGFDLRISPALFSMAGEIIQIRRGYGSVICADPAVWPCAKEVSDLWEGTLPVFLNPLYLANDLDLLVDAYRARQAPLANLIPLCVTARQTVLISLNERFGSGYFRKIIKEQDLTKQGWQLRGFDIVDLDGLISGIKGCGYSNLTWHQIEYAFGDLLNEEGLFRNENDAAQFAEMRGLEMRKHAPFVVVGILTNITCVL